MSVQAGGEEQEERDFAAEMRAKAQAKRKAMAPEPVLVGLICECDTFHGSPS